MVKKNENKILDDREVATIEDLVQATSEVDIEPYELKSGKIVYIRPLNRKQALMFSKAKMPRDKFEQKMVSMAMVEPKLTVAQVSAWQDRDKANGDLHGLTNRISEISGMTEKVEGGRDGRKSED